MSARLYPRLSVDGAHVASGDTDIEVDGVPIIGHAIGAKWTVVDGRHRLYCGINHARDEGLLTWALGDGPGAATIVQAPTHIGGNEIAAGGGRHAIGRPDPGVVLDDGTILPGYRSPTLSDDGRWLACLWHLDQSLVLFDLWGGIDWVHGVRVLDPGICAEPQFGGTSLAWERDGQIYGLLDVGNPAIRTGSPTPLGVGVAGIRQHKPCPIWIPTTGVLLVTSHTDEALLAQQWGTPAGWRLHQGEIDKGHHHGRPLGALARIVYTIAGALQDAHLDPVAVAPDDLRTVLRPPIVVVPAPPTPTPVPPPPPDPPFDVAGEYDVLDFVVGLGPWPRTGHPGHYLDMDLHAAEGWVAMVKSDEGAFSAWHQITADWLILHEDHTAPPYPDYVFTDGRWIPRRVRTGQRFRVPGNGRRDWTGTQWADPVPHPYTNTVTLVGAYDFGGNLGTHPALILDYDPRPDPVPSTTPGVLRRPGSRERTVFAWRRGIGRFESWKTPADGGPDVLQTTTVFNQMLDAGRTTAPPPRFPFADRAILTTPVVWDPPDPTHPTPTPTPVPSPEPHPMALTFLDAATLIDSFPEDVYRDHVQAFNAQVWARDRGSDLPSRGALTYFDAKFFGTILRECHRRGRLPGGLNPASVAFDYNFLADLGTQAAVDFYRSRQEPGPEDGVAIPNPR